MFRVEVKSKSAQKKADKTHDVVSIPDESVEHLLLLILAANAEFRERLENLERTYVKVIKQLSRPSASKQESIGFIPTKTSPRRGAKKVQ